MGNDTLACDSCGPEKEIVGSKSKMMAGRALRCVKLECGHQWHLSPGSHVECDCDDYQPPADSN